MWQGYSSTRGSEAAAVSDGGPPTTTGASPYTDALYTLHCRFRSLHPDTLPNSSTDIFRACTFDWQDLKKPRRCSMYTFFLPAHTLCRACMWTLTSNYPQPRQKNSLKSLRIVSQKQLQLILGTPSQMHVAILLEMAINNR